MTRLTQAFCTFDQALDGIIAGRPLLICDVDEVVLHFIRPFETYLAERGLSLRRASFALSGNIVERASGHALEAKAVSALARDFHEACVDEQPLVEGAAAGLARLSDDFQIVFLTNVEAHLGRRRAAHLASLGLSHPCLVNSGGKGARAAALAAKAKAVTVFVDDLPAHHALVGEAAPDIHCLHFMADPALRALAPWPSAMTAKAEDWPSLTRLCLERL